MKWMRLLGVIIIGCSTTTAFAAVPLSLSHQGWLAQNGVPVTGSVPLTFRIYSAGAQIYEKSETLAVDNGFYNAVLDNVDLTDVMTSDGLQLGISVDGGDEMSPRLAITSVPFALVSAHAEQAALAESCQVAGQALDVNCQGCISESELNFTFDAGKAFPFCAEREVLYSDGQSWKCTDQVTVMPQHNAVTVGDTNTDSLLYVHGKIGVGALPPADSMLFLGTGHSYRFVETVVYSPSDEEICDCNVDNNTQDCPTLYETLDDQGDECYDPVLGGVNLYVRDVGVYPLSGMTVTKEGFVGIGTSNPEERLTIGDGGTDRIMDVEIKYGGLCVDSDGDCASPGPGGIRVGATGIDGSDAADTHVFIQKTGGKVAIGTANPQATLDVQGTFVDRRFDTVSASTCSVLANYYGAGTWPLDNGQGDSATVCGEADIPYCYDRSITWKKTRDVCENMGARLCSQAEVENGEVQGTGCGHDAAWIYTSTACGSGGFMQVLGTGASSRCQENIFDTAGAGLRCCADS